MNMKNNYYGAEINKVFVHKDNFTKTIKTVQVLALSSADKNWCFVRDILTGETFKWVCEWLGTKVENPVGPFYVKGPDEGQNLRGNGGCLRIQYDSHGSIAYPYQMYVNGTAFKRFGDLKSAQTFYKNSVWEKDWT